jgi:hypothetical protein
VEGNGHVITPANYLNLQNLLVNELVGGATLALLIMLTVAVYWSIRNNLPYDVTLAVLFTVGLVGIGFAYNGLVYSLLVFIAGGIIYGLYKKYQR